MSATRTSPWISPPWKCGTKPQAALRSVDLPEAERPARRTNSPGAISSETSSSAGFGDRGSAELRHRSASAGAAPRLIASSDTRHQLPTGMQGREAAEGDGCRDGEGGGAEADRQRGIGAESVGAEELAGDRGGEDGEGDEIEAAVVTRWRAAVAGAG